MPAGEIFKFSLTLQLLNTSGVHFILDKSESKNNSVLYVSCSFLGKIYCLLGTIVHFDYLLYLYHNYLNFLD